MNGWGETIEQAKAQVARAVDAIFADIEKYHGAKYAGEKLGNTGNDAVLRIKAQWGEELIRIPRSAVTAGYRKIKEQAYCPNLANFIRMCLPTPEQAFHEAVTGMYERSHGRWFDFSCPAVYFAATFFDGDLRTGDWKKSQAKWEKVWADELERQSKGLLGDVPALQERIAYKPPEPSKPSPEVVAKIKAHGGFRTHSDPISSYMNLKSIKSAQRLIENFRRPELRRTLQKAVDHHVQVTKKLVEKDGKLIVGDASLFYHGAGNGHEQRGMAT